MGLRLRASEFEDALADWVAGDVPEGRRHVVEQALRIALRLTEIANTKDNVKAIAELAQLLDDVHA